MSPQVLDCTEACLQQASLGGSSGATGQLVFTVPLLPPFSTLLESQCYGDMHRHAYTRWFTPQMANTAGLGQAAASS